MRALARLVPALAQAHVIRVWSGIEAYLPDMIPVIGPSETTPGLFPRLRLLRPRLPDRPRVGLCLSEMILDGDTPTPLAPFGIGRFRSQTEVSEKFRREFDEAPKTV